MSESISFILPIFNTEKKFLIEGLNRLKKLAEPTCEFLLINDGSEDYVEDICQSFAQEDERFKYHYQKNQGVSVARNIGILASTKRWVFFLDPDDWIDFSTLSFTDKITHSCDVIFLGYQTIKEDQPVACHSVTSLLPIATVPSQELMYSILQWDYNKNSGYYLGTPWAKLFRRDFLIKNGLTYEKGIIKRQDALFMLNVLEKKPVIALLDICAYNYRLDHGNSVNNKYNSKISDTYIQLVTCIYQMNHLTEQELHYLAYYTATLIIDLFEKDYLNKQNKKNVREKRLCFRSFIETPTIAKVLSYLETSDSKTPVRKIKFWAIQQKKFYLLYILSKISLIKNKR